MTAQPSRTHADDASIAPDQPYDVDAIRADFPILSRSVHARAGKPGRPLVYLDNGASAQKPRQVLDAMQTAYEQDYSNVHRGVHFLSARATQAYEAARERVRRFLNAASDKEIIFTHGATEAINLVAHSFGDAHLSAGDEVVLSVMEHHANIVPWQMLRDRKGVVLKVVPIRADGSLDMDAFEAALGPRTKLVSVAHVSNVLGTVNPAETIVAMARARGIAVMFDGAQSAVHLPVDMQALDCDFYVFTGHKLYGPTGIGVLYGKEAMLDSLPPFLGGGDMIRRVTFEETTYADLPAKLEAGTPPIVEAIGLAAAIDYVDAIGRTAIAAHEAALTRYTMDRIAEVPGVTVYGTTPDKAGIVSFAMDCAHPHDVATVLDMSAGIAVRAGHHCAQPLMDHLGVTATTRASFGLYNTKAEVDCLIEGLGRVRELFG